MVAPTLGVFVGFLLFGLVRALCSATGATGASTFFRRGQLVSAALYSLGHGGNDAQKTMGIITLLLMTAGVQEDRPPNLMLWVVLLCHAAMKASARSRAAGASVNDHGHAHHQAQARGRLRRERPVARSRSRWPALMGVPVSTTHTITGSIVGVGWSERGLSAVRWGVAGRIVWAWIFTIPAAALVARHQLCAAADLVTGQSGRASAWWGRGDADLACLLLPAVLRLCGKPCQSRPAHLRAVLPAPDTRTRGAPPHASPRRTSAALPDPLELSPEGAPPTRASSPSRSRSMIARARPSGCTRRILRPSRGARKWCAWAPSSFEGKLEGVGPSGNGPRLPQPVGPGVAYIEIDVRGRGGASGSRGYMRRGLGGVPYLFTQFEPIAAREALPC